ncbi:hypothetical protein C7S13_2827 [Burkholderia cepacia]|nr:hypothetical protein [Burkholderia cepacia]
MWRRAIGARWRDAQSSTHSARAAGPANLAGDDAPVREGRPPRFIPEPLLEADDAARFDGMVTVTRPCRANSKLGRAKPA